LSGFLGFLPFILSDIIFLFKMNFSMLSIGSLVALIPRQISLINSARAIFQLLSFWRISCVSWQEVLEAVKLSENVFSQLENRIQLSKIRINDQYFDSLEKVLNYIHQTEQQVITIQGSNGSGKSTLLT
jgi:ABC-type bacteriocin/lantibiotic exporter with double-glycine peptidase domain